jgi:hypothetical protein
MESTDRRKLQGNTDGRMMDREVKVHNLVFPITRYLEDLSVPKIFGATRSMSRVTPLCEGASRQIQNKKSTPSQIGRKRSG